MAIIQSYRCWYNFIQNSNNFILFHFDCITCQIESIMIKGMSIGKIYLFLHP